MEYLGIIILNRVTTSNIKYFETKKVRPAPLRILSRAFSPSSGKMNINIIVEY